MKSVRASATIAGLSEPSNTDDLERTTLDLKGKADPFPAWIEKVATSDDSATQ